MVRLAGPGLVIRGGPERFSITLTCYRKRPVSHLSSRDELAAFKLFVLCGMNNVKMITIHIYMLKICAVFRVKCEE